MSAIVILPCPFCAFDDVEIDEIDMGIYAVCCPECETIGPSGKSVPLAIDHWNKRPEATA